MASDAIVIGGGPNGLVASYYLAKAGLKVLVLESRETVGGGAITEEFHPGFRCSTLAHVTGPLLPQIERDMQLERHGLKMARPAVRVCSLSHDGRALLMYEDAGKTAAEIAKFSAKDAAQYGEFCKVLATIAGALAPVMTQTPPDVEHPGSGDLFQMLGTGRKLRKLGKKNIYRLLRWGPMAVADLVAEWFESELLRATIAARGIFGNAMGPWSAGTGAVLLMRAALDSHPAGPAASPIGGMGALTTAMANAAKQAGVEIRTGADVARVNVKDGVADAVVLQNGEEIRARAVVSSADPKRTFLQFIDPVHLDPSFVERAKHYRCSGTLAKVNLALSGLPKFSGVNGDATALSGRVHIGPEIDYLERAFDHSKYGEFSSEPYLDITIPTLADLSLAPAGQHVMSICVQFAPYKLRGSSWDTRREELGDVILKTLSAYSRDLCGMVVARQVITPADLEKVYGLTGGHVFHGELALDQLFTMRPLLGWARYRSPIKNLFLCGSGTHPGSGLNGASGMNAAREIGKQLR